MQGNRHVPLPARLGDAFTVRGGTAFGLARGRMRGGDLATPFYGVRVREGAFADDESDGDPSPYAMQRRARVRRAREFQPRMRGQHFFSHETAASLWGAPLPLERTGDDDHIAGHEELRLHVGTIGTEALQRTSGVTRHRVQAHLAQTCRIDGMDVATPTSTWAMLGSHLATSDLVVLGDFLCRVWRPGFGRPSTDQEPLTTRARLQEALRDGRRVGAARLREALTFVREDSWSPRESLVRYHLVTSGLPEPELNVDVYDDDGRFLGCIDMAYRAQKVAVEYHGYLHSATWADDVERVARLRAAGWIVIEVTASTLKDPQRLVDRVAAALRR